MNTQSVKTGAQKGSIAIIDTLVTPLHMGVILVGDGTKAITDFAAHKLAQGEGYLVSKIDKTKNAEAVTAQREFMTACALKKAGDYVQEQDRKLRDYLNRSKKQLQESAIAIEGAIGLYDDVETQERKLEFRRGDLRKQREEIKADTTLEQSEINKRCAAINRQIAAINKELNALPKASAEEAFEPAVAQA
jgi:hypothetical protein